MYIHTHIYAYIDTHTCVYVYVIFVPSNVICMYFFRANLWALDTWYTHPWERPPLSLPDFLVYLYSSLCMALASEFSLCTFAYPLVSSMFSTHLGIHVGEMMDLFSDITRRYNIIAKFLTF